ncbi:unnamed protein product [Mycena citricolor]|uniref:non-specific serine/threonine protein kinase n=1 Tax=Mycena citricolor TaxID=2018698 RepID=A0AAD2HS35_9AGAR|nr:unnamed protein product [Mycena citricolor]
MAPSSKSCASFQYVVTTTGPKILPVEEPFCKDEESPAEYNSGGYLPVKVSDTFKNGRYTVVRKLGWGHFSTVWLVKDSNTTRHSALKVVKSAGRYAETARDEIKLLARVASFSPTHPGRPHIVSFMDSFTHHGPESTHICIVFEPLGESLLALIDRNRRKGVPRALVKIISKQVLLGLSYLHDECDLVHTDIKPENILISIPDVEAHIYNELAHSPSPTCRRVGVPPATKSRPSVSIPQQSRTTRRQVQIFDSQPLSSPRSGGPGCNSGPSSVAGSYVSPVQLAHAAKYGSLNGGFNGMSTSAPKISSGLAVSAQHTLFSKSNPVTAASSQANSPTSPASSISSTPFTLAGSIGTPPTSLSNSFGSAMLGIAAATKATSKPTYSPPSGPDRVGIPVKGKGLAVELQDALSSSWKDKLGLTKETPISISHQSTSSVSRLIQNAHKRSSSGVSVSGSWKDPGLAAPAPAVVVSAVVRADGEQQGDYFSTSSMSGSNVTPSSQSSTATARATPASTPIGTCAKSTGFDDATEATGEKPVMSANAQPSLLSRTDPRNRNAPTAVSQLSLQMQSHREPSKPAVVVPPSSSPSDITSTTPTGASSYPTSPPHSHISMPGLALPKPRPSTIPELSIKVTDLGNATPSKKHFTEDIQTRQYRSPEAIIGRSDWDARADIWSVACLVFELLTAEFLFDPQSQSNAFTKDDDHMAQIIELLGDLPMDIKKGGKYSHDLFDSHGSLRYIKSLKPWPLKRVMLEKYLWSEADVGVLCSFLLPMLAVDQRRRAHARDMLDHPWLEVTDADDIVGEW